MDLRAPPSGWRLDTEYGVHQVYKAQDTRHEPDMSADFRLRRKPRAPGVSDHGWLGLAMSVGRSLELSELNFGRACLRMGINTGRRSW